MLVATLFAETRRGLADWRRRRAVRSTYECLCGLDEHILRDLALTRTELMKVATELAGVVVASRVRCQSSAPAASADRVVRVSVSSAARVAERTFSGDDGA